jgi:rare lipoprotein A
MMLKTYRRLILTVMLSVFGMSQTDSLAKSHTHKKKYSKTSKKASKTPKRTSKAHTKLHIKKKKHASNTTSSIHKAKKPGYSAVGIASFYGAGFHGQKMANRAVFNSHDINTAAHGFLPLGTKLSVTNLSNGRIIYVEVRDRMGHGTRVIDLSQAAAKKIGMHRKGLTRVRITKISNAEFQEKKHYLEVEANDKGRPY